MRIKKIFNIHIYVLLLALLYSIGGRIFPEHKTGSEYALIKNSDMITVDLKYASSDNFMKENLYGDFNQCYLHKIAAEKIIKAAQNLKETKPGWKLHIFDCLRPKSVQQKMWNRVKGTALQPYVANPDKGSIHNYGFAADLSLEDENGVLVDMGTEFDSFDKLSQPKLEQQFLLEGKLSETQLANRQILRNAMTKAGFTQLQIEWWHYDALSSSVVRKKYQIVNINELHE